MVPHAGRPIDLHINRPRVTRQLGRQAGSRYMRFTVDHPTVVQYMQSYALTGHFATNLVMIYLFIYIYMFLGL